MQTLTALMTGFSHLPTPMGHDVCGIEKEGSIHFTNSKLDVKENSLLTVC